MIRDHFDIAQRTKLRVFENLLGASHFAMEKMKVLLGGTPYSL